MLAFVAAVGAELSSGQSVLQQLKAEPTGVVAAIVLLAVGTLAVSTNTRGWRTGWWCSSFSLSTFNPAL